ncbi:MAG: DNA primase [Clostridia bacterium]|nr:DNA primase [Clostridia bacterium]
MALGNSTIEEVKAQLDIVDVISRVVPLKKAGANYKGCCPFHNEKTPSFTVSDQKQIFTCFGCGATGDVIEFTKKYYNLDFQDAVEKLAKENGITVTFQNSEASGKREKYFELNKEAARYFYSNFVSGSNPGYTYMKSRKIEDAILKKFGIGYADESYHSMGEAFKDKADRNTLIDIGILNEKGYDKFRGRVIFPIFNASGKVVGFTGRTINGSEPKYLNSPENIVFSKKNNLYGINLAKQDIGKEGYAILVEGNVDVISLYQAGIRNVVATCGTALNENQARLLRKYTKNIVLSYDSDNAGRNASLKGIEVLTKEGLNVKVMHVTNGKDPDDFIKEFGKDAYLKLVKDAMPAVEYKLSNEKQGLDLSKEEDKIEYLKRATRIIKTLSPTVADIYTKKLAQELKVSEFAINKELENVKLNTEPVPREHKAEKAHNEFNKYEPTILKVIFINSSFIERVLQYEEIFTSDIGIKIRDMMYVLYNEKCEFELEDILDRLEVDESEYLKSVLDQISISGVEEKVFDDTIITWKCDVLRQKENELLNIIELSNDEDGNETINRIMVELKELRDTRNRLERSK